MIHIPYSPSITPLCGPFAINVYGTFIAVALCICMQLIPHNKRYKQLKLDRYFIPIIVVSVVAGIIGGRLLAVISQPEQYHHWTEWLQIWNGGFSALGSIIGVSIGTAFYLKTIHLPILPTFDLMAIYAPLFQSIARLGCLFAGCCYGKVTHSFLHVLYTHQDSIAPHNITLHPTQLYSSIMLFVIFLCMYFIVQRKAQYPGQLFVTYLMCTSAERFIIDFLRADRIMVNNSFLSFHQIIALVIFCITFLLIICMTMGQRRCHFAALLLTVLSIPTFTMQPQNYTVYDVTQGFPCKVIPSSIKKLECVACPADGTIVVAGQGGIDILDPVTHQSLTHTFYPITNDPEDCVEDIAMTNDHTQVATASKKQIMHLDSAQKQVVSIIPTNPLETNRVGFLFNNHLAYYNDDPIGQKRRIILPYESQSTIKLVVDYQYHNHTIFFACHPHKNIASSSTAKNKHKSFWLITERMESVNLCGEHTFIGSFYSPDGSFFVINEINKIIAYRTMQDGSLGYHDPFITFSLIEKTGAIALYPAMTINSHNMLALLSWDNTIQFWQLSKNSPTHLIAIIKLDPAHALAPQMHASKRIAYFYDETKIALALNQLFIIPVPFEAFYTPEKRAAILYAMFLLKNGSFEQIPHDIIWHITKKYVFLMKT